MMSNQERPSSGQPSEELAAVAGRLSQKLDLLQKETRSTKKVTRIMVILVVISALVGIYMIVSPLLSAYRNPEPYQQALLGEFEKRILPEMQKETEAMIRAAGPDIWEDVKKNVNERRPELAAKVGEEWTILMDDLQSKIQERFINKGEEFTELLQERLKQEVPLAADQEKSELIMANTYKATENAVSRVLEEHFSSHVDTVTRIQTRIAKFPVPEELKEKNEEQLSDLLILRISDFLSQTIQMSMSPEMEKFVLGYMEQHM